MVETTGELSFDKATYTTGTDGTSAPCGNCRRPVGTQYWKWQHLIVCEQCRGPIAQALQNSQSWAAVRKGAKSGGLIALGCGVAYAIFVAVQDSQWGFVTIGIGYLVGTAVRKASGGFGGRRYQVLAVALTYLATTMGYAPGVLHAVRNKSAKSEAVSTANPTKEAPPKERARSSGVPGATEAILETGETKPAPDGSSPEGAAAASKVGLLKAVAILVGVGFALFGLTLVAPLLAFTQAPIGALIIGFGLWEAWRLTRGVPLVIEGPFRVTPTAAAAMSAAEVVTPALT